MNWIGYGLIRHPEMQKYLEEEISTSLLQHSNAQFSISWMNQQSIIEQRQLLAEKELVNLDQQMKEDETLLADSLQNVWHMNILIKLLHKPQVINLYLKSNDYSKIQMIHKNHV